MYNYNHTTTKAALLHEKSPNFIFFWGHQPKKDGTINKSCFSQWFERGFEHQGVTYHTAEHWMMAEKAALFKDEVIRQRITATESAAEVKQLGRAIRGFNDEQWLQYREAIVLRGNYLKFSQHADLRAYLQSTKDAILVEASPYDKIWGIGMRADDAGVDDPNNWQGLNLLGYALMEVRDGIRTQ